MESRSMGAEEEKVLSDFIKILRQEGPTLPIATVCGRYMRANGGRKISMDIARFIGKQRPVTRFLMRHKKWLEDLGDGRVRLRAGSEGEERTARWTEEGRGNRQNWESRIVGKRQDGRSRRKEVRRNQRQEETEDNDRTGEDLVGPTRLKGEPRARSFRSWKVPRPILAGAGAEFGDPLFALSLREEDVRPPSWTWDEGQEPIRSNDIVVIEIRDPFTHRRTSPAMLFHMPTHGGKTISGILKKDRANMADKEITEFGGKSEDTVYSYMVGGEGTELPVWLDTEWRAPLIALTPWMKDVPLGNYVDMETGKESRRRCNAEALCKKIEFRRIASPRCPACGLREMRGFIGSQEKTRAHAMGQLDGICPCCDHQCPNCPALLAHPH